MLAWSEDAHAGIPLNSSESAFLSMPCPCLVSMFMLIHPSQHGLSVSSEQLADAPCPVVCLQLSLEEAATVSTVFVTVQAALCNGAAIGAGSKVLVHGATGGLGLAACQLAASVGAVVVGTAGPSKRAFLRASGVQGVFNSRDTRFSEEVVQTAAPGGSGKDSGDVLGVDVVLNSLTSPGFVAASLATLNLGGTFVEVSKRDIFSHARVTALARLMHGLLAS